MFPPLTNKAKKKKIVFIRQQKQKIKSKTKRDLKTLKETKINIHRPRLHFGRQNEDNCEVKMQLGWDVECEASDRHEQQFYRPGETLIYDGAQFWQPMSDEESVDNPKTVLIKKAETYQINSVAICTLQKVTDTKLSAKHSLIITTNRKNKQQNSEKKMFLQKKTNKLLFAVKETNGELKMKGRKSPQNTKMTAKF